MNQCYCYLRVSGLTQIDGGGLDRQLQTIEHYARDSGYEIVRVFEEAISGTTDETERPAFQEMMADILGDGVRTVLVESLDRLGREFRVQESLVIYLASKGVDLISARTGENVTEAIEADPLRKALVQMQGIFGELEKNQLVMRLKRGKERARAEGRRVDGPRRYGENSEHERQIIRKIRLLRRRRRGGYKPFTYREIADKLNQEGSLTAKGKRWCAQHVWHVAMKR